MLDELKNFLSHELDEIKKDKVRVIGLVVCLIALLIFLAVDDSSSGEEIILNDKPPATKDLPVKVLHVEKSPDGVTKVLGAKADALLIEDPFAVEEKPKLEPPPPRIDNRAPKISEVVPPIAIQPPKPKTEPSKETLTLKGTAISGDNKRAMILRGDETLFLTIGDEISGRKISDITADFVTFDNGERVYLQKELN